MLKKLVKGYDNAMDRRQASRGGFTGAVAIITGVASPKGLGAQAARRFVAMGGKVIILDYKQEVHDIAEELGVENALALRVDVTDEKAMQDALHSVQVMDFIAGRQVRVVWANAGIFIPTPALAVNIEAMNKMWAVNVAGAMITLKIGRMLAAKQCVFIASGSAAAKANLMAMDGYNVTKAALAAHVETLITENLGNAGWQFINLELAQIAGTDLTEFFGKFQSILDFFDANPGAQLFNRHKRPAPAIRNIIRVMHGGRQAMFWRVFPFKIWPLVLFPNFVRPLIRKVSGAKNFKVYLSAFAREADAYRQASK